MGGVSLGLLCAVLAAAWMAAWIAIGFGQRSLRAVGAGVAGVGRWLSALPLARRVRLSDERSHRRAACLSELPVLLDVVTLGLSAGLSFDAALELYCSRYKNELADCFSEAMLSWRIGARTREEALWDLAEDLEVTALRRFASVVGESLSFGSPLAQALERQAQAIRDEQRSQVEEEIERLPVKMLIPLGTLIVPAMFLAILGPLLGSTLTVG